jgi:pimeloyl-ACP methyl ester carboxylesterase
MRSIEHSVRAVAIDLRGHGDSDWGEPGTYNIETHTTDVSDVMSRLGIERRILIGHSMGAQILMRIAVKRPELVKALVLVDFGPETNVEARERIVDMLRESLRLYGSTAEYARWLGNTRPLMPPEWVEHMAVSSLRLVEEGGYRLKIDPALVDAMDASSPRQNDALWRMLSDITCPVLVIRGGGSAVLSQQTAQRMVSTLRNGQLATVSWAGHGVMMDSPHEFNQIVSSFVGQHA